MINAFYLSMLQNGSRKDGKIGGYSTGSIRKTHNVLSSIMRTAVEWEVIDRNPCSKVRVPIAPSTADNIKFFTPEQTISFLNYIEHPHSWGTKGHKRIDDTGKEYEVGAYTSQRNISFQMKVLFQTAIYTGARKGELLALKWSDLNGNIISINKAVTVVKGTPIIKVPKTRTSCREITIPQSLVVSLKKLRMIQTEFRLQSGDYWHDEGWIFTQDNGHMMSYSTPYHALQRTIQQYNAEHPDEEQLPLIPFHGLRHTSATLLIAEHQDVKTVSARLGHAQTSTTMNIYTHALQESDQRASDALENLLKKGG